MKTFMPLWMVLLLLLWLPATEAVAQFGGLRAPFGFYWGDDIGNMRKILTGAGCTIEREELIDDRTAWTVSGLVRPGMRHAIFFFKRDALVEIELVYREEKWDDAQYDKLMLSNAEFFTKALGPPRKVKEEGEIEPGVNQQMLGFEWGEFDTQLLLLNYRVIRGEETFQSMSVHYRYAFAEDLDNAGENLSLEDINDPLPISENESVPGGDLPTDPVAPPEIAGEEPLPVGEGPIPLPAGPATEPTEPTDESGKAAAPEASPAVGEE